MKQSDIFTVIIIATVGTLVAYFGVNSLLGDPNMQSVKVKTIDVIEASVETPDPELFNFAAINPTVEVYVGDCEDVDKNGLLSKEELIACGKVDKDTVKDLVFCADGSAVEKAEDCPITQTENQTETETQTQTENLEQPTGSE